MDPVKQPTFIVEKDLITLLGIDRPSDRLKAQLSSSQSWVLPQRPSAPSVAPWSRPGNSLSGGIVISVVADHSATKPQDSSLCSTMDG